MAEVQGTRGAGDCKRQAEGIRAVRRNDLHLAAAKRHDLSLDENIGDDISRGFDDHFFRQQISGMLDAVRHRQDL